MSRRVLGFVAGGALALSVLSSSPAEAAGTNVLGVNGANGACSSAFGAGGNCFIVDGKLTARLTAANTVETINPVTAYVGETISLTNQSGSHNIYFCRSGVFIPGSSWFEGVDWTCGDPIASYGGAGGQPPHDEYKDFSPGSPTTIGFNAPSGTYSTTLDTAGDYYFWCAIGNHARVGQYGKLVVKAGSRPTTTTSPPTTVASTTTTSPAVATTQPGSSPQTTVASTTSPSGSVVAAPTLVVRRSAGRVTATGRATPGAGVTLQKQVGKTWRTVGRATATRSGTYTIRVKSESKSTAYRVVVGSRASPTRRV